MSQSHSERSSEDAAVPAQRRRKLLVICPFPQGVAPGQRLKYEQYFDDWRAQGFDIDVSCFMDLAMWRIAYARGRHIQKLLGVLRGHLRRVRDLFRVARYDVVYVFMWVTPVGTTIMERLVRALAPRLIFDVEDDVLKGQQLPGAGHPNPIARLLKRPAKARFLMQEADYLIAASPFMRDKWIALNKHGRCACIPASIDTDRIRPLSTRSTEGPVVIGWTGTFSTKPFLDLLRPVFIELASRVSFQLTIIGNFDYELPGVNLKVIQWSSECEVEDLQSLDIGVYPLPDESWSLGKSGLKAFQYMAVGIPTVASAVGTTPAIIRDGENGFLIHEAGEWAPRLERLVRDAELRKKMGEQARRDVVAHHSVAATTQKYREVLRLTLDT